MEEEVKNTQRHNIFYTRCLILDRMCTLVVDGASCDNLVSATLVKELKVETFNHPRPCKLQWLNTCGELKVNKVVKIPFMIGDYKDEVICGVVPLHACRIILGRPWLCDRDVLHQGGKNHYSLKWKGKLVTLEPLEPSQVLKEQMSSRTSLKNAKRKSKDERQKKERSEGEKSDNSRVEKGENVWSEVSELSQEKSEELDKKMREKKVEKQKEIEDFPYSNATNLSSFSSCFVSCVGNFGEEPSSNIQPTLKSLKEDQSIFSRELMEFIEQIQGKENTLEVLQGKIAYPSTLDTLVDCGDTLSLKDTYDIDEFDNSLSCDEKNNCGLQLAKSSC
ncbi:uncharacterized protein [Nicotiana sylvestris]|uniref:Uncharacterized protein LOC104238195 isoform X1 n=1 Tax=Nicotiana sylvestris TaxID=4096 RepID=A0A1U7XME6_NICSY|nr:PREDICTED: uncharacterized protein LOC104238195 isoform X1 [Nicotiana sylvestris]